MPRSAPAHAPVVRLLRSSLAPAMLALAALPVGCSGDKPQGRVLAAGDFARSESQPRPNGPRHPPLAATPPDTATPVAQMGALTAQQGILDVSAAPGPPPLPVATALPVETPALANEIVGEINGSPIYADEFLADLQDILRAKAAELAPDAWTQFATEAIGRKLDGRLVDILLEAEARAALTPQQRQGLKHFVEEWRGDLRSENQGSAALTNERLLDESQKTEEEFLKDREIAELIRHQLKESISSKVQVSWRDITRHYLKNYDLYNPPPTARFRLIRVASDKPADIERITAGLAAGEPFADLATLPINTFSPETGGRREPVKVEGEFAQGKFFEVPELNDAARALTPGAVAGPIPLGGSTMWLHLESIDREAVSLFDAQRGIENELRRLQTGERLDRYIQRLRDRSTYTDISNMTTRLVQIAASRHLP